MECVKTRGIVTKRTEYGEANCILTILTEDLGIVSATVYGVKSAKNRMKSAAQILCCSEFVLNKKHGDLYRVESADIIEPFLPVAEDLTKLSLANYFCDAAYDAYSDEDKSVLSLLLNSLYALAYKDYEQQKIKAAFELKLMQLNGYEPGFDECISCKDTENLNYFSLNGGVSCEKCHNSAMIKVSEPVKNAMQYIINTEMKKLFSFTVGEAVLNTLSLVCESYLLSKSEKKYKSLEYYKKIL